jgi:hypothetical protein
MKITKRQLKQIIKEELEVILTNEEAGELFGEDIKKQLDELEQVTEGLEGEETAEPEPRVSGDVARVGKKLGQVGGIENLLASINTRAEFEQFLMKIIQMVAKEKLKPEDVKVGIKRVATQVLRSK